MSIDVGQPAPDFTLDSTKGDPVTLSGLRGKKVVLAFYPAAFTGGWTNELTAFSMECDKYVEQDAQILAISCNSRFSLSKFAESLNDPDFPLLADFWPHGAVGEAYGVFNNERGLNARSIFIVDRDGVVQYAKLYEPGTLPENEELLAELAKIA